MGSRVCDIKKKFEGLNESSTNKNPALINQPLRLNNISNTTNVIKNDSNRVENHNSLQSGAKGIIKRSHAFRTDRASRNICLNEALVCQLDDELAKSQQKVSKSPCSVEPKLDISTQNKSLHTQGSLKNTSLHPSNNRTNTNKNIKTIDNSSYKHLKNGTKGVVSEQKVNLPVEYSVVIKDRSKSAKAQKPPTVQDEISLKSVDSEQEPIKKEIKTILKENYPTETSDLKSFNTKFPTKNVSKNSSYVPDGNVENNMLSNTLKKVLSSPLPSGPPPKKPPRTFAHTTELFTNNIEGCSKSDAKGEFNLDSSQNNPKPMIRPLRSKTESQIMLKKLEVALQKHNQGKVIESKIEKKRDHSEEMDKRSLVIPDSTKINAKQFTNIAEKSLPDTPKDKYGSSSGCFGVISCSNSMDLVRSSHVYDVPFESKSQFYLKDVPNFSSFQVKESSPFPNSRVRPTTLEYGKINQIEKYNKEEPIYAKPENKLILRHGFNQESKKTSVSDIIKSMNKTELEKIAKDEPLCKSSVLHYMSSPIVEKACLLQSPPPLPPNTEKKNSALKKVVGNSNSKSLPSRSFIADLENSVVKKSNNRSYSVDITRQIDKELLIDNEKIQMLVTEAYNKCLSMPQDSDSESVASTPDEGLSKPLPGKHTPEEIQKERQQRTAERKTYLKRVCSRAKSFHRPSVTFPRLFEYLLLIGLDLNPARCKVPYIKAKYPQDAVVPEGIEQLCFPDANDWPPQACVDETGLGSCYCIVITHASGTRKYGYCRRVQPEGAPICLPLAYCIVSPYKANSYFAQVLAELESRHGQPEQLLSDFINQLYQSPFPAPGHGIRITNPNTCDKTEILVRKLDPRQEEMDIACLLNLVRFSVFLQMFGTLLLERKVILLSYSISKLSKCIEGLCAALYPFHWQHTLVPIVPSTMLEICQAPTPYVIGLIKPREAHSQLYLSFSSIDQVLVVDVDESRVVQSCGDESAVLPPRLCRGLREALACAVPDKTLPLSSAHNLIASEALIALFVQLVGHYRDHIITSSTTGQRQFQRDSFVKSIPSNTVQSFLDWFSETTMFTAFIESRLDRSIDPRGLFEQRCVEYLAQQQQAASSKSYRANINKTVKSFGDRFKEWTNST